jgi:hypothetical protein
MIAGSPAVKELYEAFEGYLAGHPHGFDGSVHAAASACRLLAASSSSSEGGDATARPALPVSSAGAAAAVHKQPLQGGAVGGVGGMQMAAADKGRAAVVYSEKREGAGWFEQVCRARHGGEQGLEQAGPMRLRQKVDTHGVPNCHCRCVC